IARGRPLTDDDYGRGACGADSPGLCLPRARFGARRNVASASPTCARQGPDGRLRAGGGHMSASEGRIAAAWAGAVTLVLSLAVVALVPLTPPSFPALGAPASFVAAYYEHYRARFLFGNYVAALGLVPSLVLLAYVTMLIKKSSRDPGWIW